MKKVILTIIYPFWFFLASTLIGSTIMLVIIVTLFPLSLQLLLPEFMNNVEDPESFGMGMAILSIFMSPFTAIPFLTLSAYLESNYEKWGYKTELNCEI